MMRFLAVREFFIGIDAFLIDRIFQPISDKLARIVSCYAIAAFLLTGAMPLNFILGWMAPPWWLPIIAIIWMPYLIYRAYLLEASPLTNVQPKERIEYCAIRLWFFCGQVFTIPWDISNLYAGDYHISIETISWWLIIFGLYFMACRRNPPKPKTVMAEITA